MTRINLIDPKALTDQHLFAEYREITRIFGRVQTALAKYPAQSVLAKFHHRIDWVQAMCCSFMTN